MSELELCHRLDRETAGLVLITKEQKYRAKYQQLFAKRKIKKIYHAVSNPPPSNIEFPLTIKSRLVKSTPFYLMKEMKSESESCSCNQNVNSESKIEIIKNGEKDALYKLTPITGKKHQLRVHMASLGLAIRNDSFYPELQERKSNNFSAPLQLLAKSISFIDPFDHQQYQFFSSFELCLSNE